MNKREISALLLPLLERVFNSTIIVETASTDSIESWDSLNHINLMFELESLFCVTLSPDDIALLFSDTVTIIDFLSSRIE